MNVEINTLYWDNGAYLIESHKKVTEHLKIPVNYHNVDGANHGLWMDYVLENSKSDIIGFLDNDCVPLNMEIVNSSIEYVTKYRSFIGVAQSSNHIYPYNHIFAAPSFFFISKKCWVDLGKPSFAENKRSDVAEEISYLAEENKVPYKAIYPTYYERSPLGGVWRLSNYGNFGIGTLFGDSIYHLYQGRYQQNADLFKTRCQDIVNGTFLTDGMIPSICF